MTRDEWLGISSATFGEWWDAPQSPERIESWFSQLHHFDASNVLTALTRLLRESASFAPKLGQLLNALEPQPPAWDSAWPVFVKAVGRYSTFDKECERQVLEHVERAVGPIFAGWVATYGCRRLAFEEVESEIGGAVLHRLRASYAEASRTVDGRQQCKAAARCALEAPEPVKALGRGDVD